jgi:hypothetical protein
MWAGDGMRRLTDFDDLDFKKETLSCGIGELNAFLRVP